MTFGTSSILTRFREDLRPGLDPWVGKIPWRRKWQLTPVLLLGRVYGRRSLVGYSPWGCKQSDMTERLHFASVFCVAPHLYPFIRHWTGLGCFHILAIVNSGEACFLKGGGPRFRSLPKGIQLLSNRFPDSLLHFPNFKTFALI